MYELFKKNKIILVIVVIIILLTVYILYDYISGTYLFERNEENNINFSTYSKNNWGHYYDEKYILFRDQDTWEQFLNDTYYTHFEGSFSRNESYISDLIEENSQDLDFENHVYFGAFWGLKGTGGYIIEILDVILEDNKLFVYIEKKEPEGGVTQAFTTPHHIISIEKEDIPTNVEISIKFINESEVNQYLIAIVIILSIIMIIIMVRRKKKNT